MFFLSFFGGASLGSFLCLIEERIHNHQSIISPRSHCNHCNHPLGVIDLIPGFSYLFLGGRCRYCNSAYESNSFQVEIFLGLSFLQLQFSFSFEVMLTNLVLTYCYLTDLREQKILTILPIILSVIILPFRFTFLPDALLLTTLIGIIIYFNRGMGLGDLLVLFPLSLILGLKNVCILLVISCALIFEIYILKRNSKVPFVPYLSWGFLLTNFLNHFLLFNN